MKLSISTAAANADMSLEDIIKKSKAQNKKKGTATKNNLKGVKQGGVTKKKVNQQGKGQQQKKRAPQQQNFRRNAGFRQNNQNFRAPQQMQRPQGGSSKLEISNLDYGVTDQDVRELFSEFGMIKNSAIHYGSNGISLGTAHVNFANPNSARAALQRYNGVRLDGRPMRIDFKDGGMNFQKRLQPNRPQQGQFRKPGGNQQQRKQGGNQQRKQGGNQQGRKQGGNKPQQQGQKKKPIQKKKPAQKKPMTAEQLNAQLDAYKAKI